MYLVTDHFLTIHEMFVLKILFPTVTYERCQLVEGIARRVDTTEKLLEKTD